MKSKRIHGIGLASASLLLLFSGCTVGPSYEQPEIDQPNGFRTIEGEISEEEKPLWADLMISEIISDQSLLDLIDEALLNNDDMQIATARVFQAEAAARLAGSRRFPSLGLGGSWTAARASELGPTPIPSGTDPQGDYTTIGLSVPAYEIDIWGRARSATRAAKARLLASEATRQVVRQTIVTQVMILYADLIRLDSELNMTRNSLNNWQDSFKLTEARESGGVASLLDVNQSEVLVESALANEIDVLRRIAETENELSFLVGRNPGNIQRSAITFKSLDQTAAGVGMPSSILLRRPDILAAEQKLIAANADIGEVRAAYYPNISLTGSYGYQSIELSDLFESPARLWEFAPSVNLPILTGGRRRAENDRAEAAFQEVLTSYRQTVRNAFKEVSNALVAYESYKKFRIRQQRQTESWKEATRLSNLRYEGGVTSYSEVLYNEQEYFGSQLAAIQATRNESVALIQLYRALGGAVEPGFSLEEDE